MKLLNLINANKHRGRIDPDSIYNQINEQIQNKLNYTRFHCIRIIKNPDDNKSE